MALSYVAYTANGSTQQFDLTFSYIEQSHIKVYVNNVEDSSFTWINSSRIQTASMPSNGQVVKIERNTPTDSRLVDFQDGSTLTETDLDKSANQNFYTVQENLDDISDCLKKDNTAVYDAGSVRIKNLAAPTSGSDAATKTYIDTQTTSAATSATAAATSATAAATSATASATSATASATSATAANTAKTAAETAETNAETAETNAETAETNAETAETNAAASATTATTKATAAATSATAAASSASTASTQASNASTSASTASTQATNASNSATAAASSATSAAASYDSFDDRYLGVKSSDPSVDNDGASLLTGALYWNSSAGNLRVYSGSAWVAIVQDTDVKVIVSSNDTTAGYLNGKLVAGTAISFTENNDGGNETLTINATDPTALAIALG